MHMDKNYKEYTFDLFLEDDYFLDSIYNPTAESDLFWENQIKNHLIDITAYKQAKHFILELIKETESSDHILKRTSILWERIENSNKRSRFVKYRKYTIAGVSIAASLILTLFFINKNWISFDRSNLSHSVELGDLPKQEITDKIQLINSGNSIIILGDSATIDYRQKEKIIVNNEVVDNKKSKTEYNQLVVPYGKRSFIILADGSKIWVNAGTRLTYPISFAKDVREIYVDGEIYADIAPDKNIPFIVKTKDIDVKVLGTELNITAYEDDVTHSVVLVEGSVLVEHKSDKKEKVTLKPNQMFYTSHNASHVENIDVMTYISWKSGYSLFRNEKLGIILNRLSRYYGTTIECDNNIYDLRCSGGLDLKDDITRVLDGICQSVSVEYVYNNNQYKFSINQ